MSHEWMSHVTCKWVLLHMDESCHICMNAVTYWWVVSHWHMKESCHIWMSHVTYKWFTSHVVKTRLVRELGKGWETLVQTIFFTTEQKWTVASFDLDCVIIFTTKGGLQYTYFPKKKICEKKKICGYRTRDLTWDVTWIVAQFLQQRVLTTHLFCHTESKK